MNTVIIMYKGKILLSTKEIVLGYKEKFVWSFLDADKLKNLKMQTTQLQSLDKGLHYIKLTDENVFGIHRKNGSRLEFYGLSEISSMLLSTQSQDIFSRYKDDIVKILAE